MMRSSTWATCTLSVPPRGASKMATQTAVQPQPRAASIDFIMRHRHSATSERHDDRLFLSSVLFVHRCTLLWVFTLTLARRAATQSQRRRITWLIDIHFFTFSPSPLSVYAALSLNHYLNGLLLCLIVCVRHCIMNCIMIIIIKNERAAFERDGTTLLVFSPFASSQWLLSPWLASHSNLESVNYHTLFSHSLCIFTSSSSSKT